MRIETAWPFSFGEGLWRAPARHLRSLRRLKNLPKLRLRKEDWSR